MSATFDQTVQMTSTPDSVLPTVAAPVAKQASGTRYPTHVVVVLAVLAALLIILAFNAIAWYWCLTHRYARKIRGKRDQEMGGVETANRAETPMWGNAYRSASKLSFNETDRSSTIAPTPLEELQKWRWPTATAPQGNMTVSIPPPTFAKPIILGSPSSRSSSPLTIRAMTEPTPPKPVYAASPSSRSASPLTIRAQRMDSPSRAGTPSRMETLDLTAAYSMPYDHVLGTSLPSPPPPGGLSPTPPRLQVRTTFETKERGRRSPLFA